MNSRSKTMDPNYYIACDLGAESGRVMLARLEDGRLSSGGDSSFSERCGPRSGLPALGRAPHLRGTQGRVCARSPKRNPAACGISVDSWGVDYVLINAVHPMISPPFHYRDDRTATTYEKVRESVGSKLIFEETGIQFMPINTIYHLASDVEKSRAILGGCGLFPHDWRLL